MPARLNWTLSRRLALATFLIALAGAASATTVARQSLESLIDSSELVVRGTVERLELRAPDKGPPFQLAYVRVSETVAGPAPELVPVRLPGGMTAEGLGCAVAGTPRLDVGDDVFLFLSAVPTDATRRLTRVPVRELRGRSVIGGVQPARQWQPIALALGTWRVFEGAAGPEVLQDPASLSLHQVGDPVAALPVRIDLHSIARRVRERKARP